MKAEKYKSELEQLARILRDAKCNIDAARHRKLVTDSSGLGDAAAMVEYVTARLKEMQIVAREIKSGDQMKEAITGRKVIVMESAGDGMVNVWDGNEVKAIPAVALKEAIE